MTHKIDPSHPSQKLPRQAISLVNIGVLQPRKLPKPSKPRSPTTASVMATYTSDELERNPELQAKLCKIQEFFEVTQKYAKDSDYKFSQRNWIIDVLAKEVDEVRKKITHGYQKED